MSKAFRNTVFTLSALLLAALGISWNQDTANRHRPIVADTAVLAGLNTRETDDQQFPLTITTSPAVKLGQFQEIAIATVPEAALEIITTYPDGSTNNPQTLRATASSSGKYTLRFKLNDFRQLGLFRVSVVAVSGNKTATGTAHFVLQTWGNSDSGNPNYQYPLVP